jgi:pimeloyl-ACP methyl ester carboxylesterase
MPILERAGAKLHYDVHGSGPALILTHGYSATLDMWQGQVEPLARDHTLVLWDMRGHGKTDGPAHPDLFSEAETVADIAALLDVIHAKRAVVGGLSLGGYMSLAFHLRHPERVRALLILDTGPGFRKAEAREAWNARAMDTAKSLESKGLDLLRELSPERATSKHRSAAGLAMAARGMLTQRDARVIESLPNIRVPSLVVVGDEDTPFLASADYMAAKIPGAKKVVIANAGHASNMDQPQAFNTAVIDFLHGLPAG